MPSHITYYNQMPIPPLEAQTEFIDAGPLRFGVEYRLLSEAVTASSPVAAANGTDKGDGPLDDRGVSLHVYGVRDGEALEHLRFDCFDEDPHYHYISWKDRSNVMLHLDPIADGDPLQWTLERLRTRLPQMLEHAGAADIAAELDQRSVDAVLPRLAEAAYRARYHHDDNAILADALKPA